MAVATVGYGIGCYLAFVGVFVYAVAFLADVVVPRTVDRGGPHAGTATAVVIDATLLAGFALQHSVMARPGFKRRWKRVVPQQVERSTYVLMASAALSLVFWHWRPLPTLVWHVPTRGVRFLLWGLYAAGWAWALAMTFAIDHTALFGLRQVSRRLRGLKEQTLQFAVPWPHRWVRHPMMLGFFAAFVATPEMSVGHLLFAALGAAYILLGVRLEEKDLDQELPEYRQYAAITPRFVPGWPGSYWRRRTVTGDQPAEHSPSSPGSDPRSRAGTSP
jgi:protein-S-isoprenylcysteine O-methyltransferase Ste14